MCYTLLFYQVSTDEPHGTLVDWNKDPNQDVIYGSKQPVVRCNYTTEFSVSLARASHVTSFRVHELLIGSNDQERRGLAVRKVLRHLAPQTMENPIYFHLTNSSSTVFRKVQK